MHGSIGSATVPLPPGTLLDLAGLSPTHLWAAGGMVSTAGDVTRFYARLVGGGLLPPQLSAAMRTLAPRSSFGLGVERLVTRCGPAFGHDGDFPGYRSVVYGRPDGRRVAVVLVNIGGTHVSWSELHTAAARSLLRLTPKAVSDTVTEVPRPCEKSAEEHPQRTGGFSAEPCRRAARGRDAGVGHRFETVPAL